MSGTLTTKHRSTPYYAIGDSTARHDGRFVEKVACCLMLNFGRPVRVESEVGGDAWVVREAVNVMTRYGADVLAVRGTPGYILMDWVPSVTLDTPLLRRETRLLLANFGEHLDVAGLLKEDPRVVHQDMHLLTMVGFAVDGRLGDRTGYRMSGWTRPQRWCRLTTLAHDVASVEQIPEELGG